MIEKNEWTFAVPDGTYSCMADAATDPPEHPEHPPTPQGPKPKPEPSEPPPGPND